MLPKTWKEISAYVHTKRDPLSPHTQLYAFWMTHQLRMYLNDGSFLNQKAYKKIRISYSLKYTHSKNKFRYEKANGSVGWNKDLGEQH